MASFAAAPPAASPAADLAAVLAARPPVQARVSGSGPAIFAAPLPEMRLTTPGAGDARARALSPAADAPHPPVFWRIDPDGRVQRSTDGGLSWNEVGFGDDVFITAGSAPVAGVCWLVDRGGRVFRSTNTADFTRTAFEEPVQLVGVEAIDASRAVVTSADGRRFATADAGASWRPGAQPGS